MNYNKEDGDEKYFYDIVNIHNYGKVHNNFQIY